jgi:hypothetical protein
MSSKYGRTPGETSPSGNGSFSGAGDEAWRRGAFSEDRDMAQKLRNVNLESSVLMQKSKEEERLRIGASSRTYIRASLGAIHHVHRSGLAYSHVIAKTEDLVSPSCET